eukprot:TRINITY_DN650_c6_g1_i1.p1 TRINITY_DN650_c6_g1~~TRINITY_DN650_c6_g1_i1.p1  ORF type:complete len:1134 (+),score=187.87 TRINITY_DN650_c6_g1_i1:90-3491(+)
MDRLFLLMFVAASLVLRVNGQCESSCEGLLAEYQRRSQARSWPSLNSSDVLSGMHKPTIVISGDFGFVTVGDGSVHESGISLIHPMSGRDPSGIAHFIDAILVVDQDNKMVSFKQFSPVSSDSAFITFRIPKGTVGIKAYSYCNIHGLYESEIKEVLPAVGSTQAKCYPEVCSADPNILKKMMDSDQLKEPLTDTIEIQRHTPELFPVNDTHAEVAFNAISGSTMTTNQDSNPDVIHYIDALFLTDENDNIFFSRVYPPSTSLPMETFEIPASVIEITPHAHCNRHGMFTGTTMIANSTGSGSYHNFVCMSCSNPISNSPGYQAADITKATCKANDVEQPACIDGINRPDDLCKCELKDGTSELLLEFPGPINVKGVIIQNQINSEPIIINECGGSTCQDDFFSKSVTLSSASPIAADEIIIDGASSFTDVQNRSSEFMCSGASPLASEARRKQIASFGDGLQIQAETTKKHTPFLSVRSSSRARVTVGGSGPINVGDISPDALSDTPLHPMNADHFIETIFVEDQNGVVIASASLLPTSGSSPTFEFDIPTNTTSLTPYEYCNIHGLFKGPTVELVLSSTSDIPVTACNSENKFQMCGNQGKSMVPLCDDSEMCDFFPKQFQSKASSVYNMKHTPVVITPLGGVGVVTVELPNHPFPSNPLDIQDPFTIHKIDYIWAVDASSGLILAFGVPKPFQKPSLKFYNNDPDINIVAYAHCNIHGTYRSIDASVTISDNLICSSEASIPNGQCLGISTSTCSDALGVVSQYDGTPLTDSSSIDKHTPRIEIDNRTVTITVGSVGNIHPMTASKDKDMVHYIDAVWVTVNTDIPLYVWYPNADQNGSLVIEFVIPEFVTSIKPHIHCNKHGTFSGSEYAVMSGNPSITLLDDMCQIKSCQSDPTPLDCDSVMAELLRLNETASVVRSSSVLKHTPYIVIRGKTGVVTVGAPSDEEATPFHPMTPGSTPHYIDRIVVEDDMKNIIAVGSFLPTEPYAQLTFDIPPGTKTVQAYEFCNLHGLYAGPVVDTESLWINDENRSEPSCQVSKCMRTGCAKNLFPAADLPPPGTPNPTSLGEAADSNNAFLIAIIMIVVLLVISGLVYMGYRMRKMKQKDTFRNNTFMETKNLMEDGKEMDTAL